MKYIFCYTENFGIISIILSSTENLINVIGKLTYDTNFGTFCTINGINSLNISKHDLTFTLSNMFKTKEKAKEIVNKIATTLNISNYDTIGFEDIPTFVK